MAKTEQDEALWAKAAPLIEKRVGRQSFNLWLSQVIPISVTPQRVELGVPSLYAQEFINARLYDDVVSAFEQVLGARPELRLSINGYLFRKMRSQVALDLEGESAAPPAGKGRRGATGYARQVFKLSARYTLDRFVVGPGNELAYRAVVEAASKPGELINPLFIHGSSGLGKTHLLQGMAHAILKEDPRARVLYVTSEYFTNQYVTAIKGGRISRFRDRFRGVDTLVVDDVHGLGGKTATQEEFLQTFNRIVDGARQIVLASDAHPRALERIRGELMGRFVSGMVAEMRMPGRATREHIVRRKLQEHNATIDADVIRFLAERVSTSVRELEGAVVRLVAYSSLSGEPVTLALAVQAVSDYLSTHSRHVTLPDIENAVISTLSVTHAEMHSRRRKRHIVFARQVCMTLARMLTDTSLNEIGRYFGGKNHATVLFSDRKIRARMESEAEVKELVDRLADDIRRR